jgi:hypothetical protein
MPSASIRDWIDRQRRPFDKKHDFPGENPGQHKPSQIL